ncbi:hypothetical protein [Pseudomonas fragariae (ex Marin et al. 2024)]|uniref:hypothetical protein n=1 Tax=Pseudomonas fragariae (ex Marin et al. 2024) TaxID=3080056 RepID=UPI003F78BDCD
MTACLFCKAAPADLGRYCSGCYGREFYEDGSPLVLGDPADPWREFNAEANRVIADQKLHAVLAPRMAAKWTFPVKVAAWKLGAKNAQRNTNCTERTPDDD